MNIVVLERHSVGVDVDVDGLKEFGDVTYYRNTTLDEVAQRVVDADIIVANKSPLNESTLKDAHNVKLIAEFATGYDNVDLEYCRKRNIAVCNVRNYSTAAVAQHTFAMLLYLLEHLRHYDEYVKGGQYGAQDRFSNFDNPFCELEGKVWGIVGLGNIGKKVAAIAREFGCRVICCSASGRRLEDGYEQVDLDTLLAQSDVVSLHCPLTDKTMNLIDKDALSKMKPTAYLINVARGRVVNNEDLYDALINNVIAGAGLDVITDEPIRSSNPLSTLMDSDKLIITPHLAWASVEARQRCVDMTCDNIRAFIAGKPINVVN